MPAARRAWLAAACCLVVLAATTLLYRAQTMYRPYFLSPAQRADYLLSAAHSAEVSGQVWPRWLVRACPTVAAHFSANPYFANFTGMFPVMTTSYAAHIVCTLLLVRHLAEAVGAPLYLHAGAHLGAILHGGPTPWDDDIDAILPLAKRDAFLAECARSRDLKGLEGGGAHLECITGQNALKVSIVTADSERTHRGWASPFVDLFFYIADGSELFEVLPSGKTARERYKLADYFPVQPYQFAGITVLGPRKNIALARYDANRCVVSCGHHRTETERACRGEWEVSCDALAAHFPFNNLTGEAAQAEALTASQELARSLWATDVSLRHNWSLADASLGQQLSDAFPNLNVVEEDNRFADSCRRSADGTLIVVEFNAERGAMWHTIPEMVSELEPDVIILNEMDIGMARSGQQHTTRLLASALRMNYAYGVEFIELTRGTQAEQDDTQGLYNFVGLHGNAILSRCPLSDAVIFRDPIGSYFDAKSNKVNADGRERRLGGRMGLFARMRNVPTNETLVLGSVHKVETHKAEMRAYIGAHRAVVAGDQDWSYCTAVGLKHADSKSHGTYPASCTSTGTHRGDILCSNGAVHQAERTFVPCPQCPFGLSIRTSDHAYTAVTLRVWPAGAL